MNLILIGDTIANLDQLVVARWETTNDESGERALALTMAGGKQIVVTTEAAGRVLWRTLLNLTVGSPDGPAAAYADLHPYTEIKPDADTGEDWLDESPEAPQ